MESLFIEPPDEEEEAEFQDVVAFKNRRKRLLGTLTVDLKNLPKSRRRISFLPDNEEDQG